MTAPYLVPEEFAVIAHRGGSLEAPENTLAAFENAYNIFNKIYFELDIHCTRDGEIVVMHDNTVDRTTNGHGQVTDLNYKELEKLDAAFFFSRDGGKTFPFRDRGVKIPLLGDVLLAFPETRVTIEVKKDKIFYGEKIIRVLEKFSNHKRFCIAGEDHKTLIKIRKLAPDLCSGCSSRELKMHYIATKLRMPPFLGLPSRPAAGQVMQIPYSYNKKLIASQAFINRAHKQNKYVHVWTVNDEPTMKTLVNLELKVDGIITDAPTLLLKVAREAKKI